MSGLHQLQGCYGVQVHTDVCRSQVSSLSPSQSCQARRWIHDTATSASSSSVALSTRKTGIRNQILAPHYYLPFCIVLLSFLLSSLVYLLYGILGQRTRAGRGRPERIPSGISASRLAYSVYRSAMDARMRLIIDRKPIHCMYCMEYPVHWGNGSKGE